MSGDGLVSRHRLFSAYLQGSGLGLALGAIWLGSSLQQYVGFGMASLCLITAGYLYDLSGRNE